LRISFSLRHTLCLERSFFASGASAVAITASDLNRDGKPDLVIGNFVLDFAPPNVNVVFHK
jgi:hypothetical protein